MKKQYINPTMEVIKLHTQQVLAASKDAVLGGSQGNGDALGREDEFDWDGDPLSLPY